ALRRTNHVDAGRRLERELRRVNGRIALAVGKIELYRLPQVIVDQHANELVMHEAQLGTGEIRGCVARLDEHPVKTVTRAAFTDVETLAQLCRRPRQQ